MVVWSVVVVVVDDWPAAPAVPAPAAPVAPAPMLLPPAADWLVHVSEMEFTVTTCSEPSDPCVPVMETWCASLGFNVVLSPLTLIVWPLSVASVQLPPDCFRQPVIVVWPLAPLVAVALPCWLLSICALLAAPVAVDPVAPPAAAPAGPVFPTVP